MTASGRRTPEDLALREVLNEIDDIARATLGSITIATMRKLVERRGSSSGRRSKADLPGRRDPNASLICEAIVYVGRLSRLWPNAAGGPNANDLRADRLFIVRLHHK